jgi:hypothetical protein
MIRPRRIVAIGRDAAMALTPIDVPLQVVRHPSYGGQTDFIDGLRAIYGCVDAGGHDEETRELSLF